jgi:DinB superfamily
MSLVQVRRLNIAKGRTVRAVDPTSRSDDEGQTMAADTRDPTKFTKTPEGFRDAWTLIEATWAATTQRAWALPPNVLTTRVNGEWSFVETLRHLIFATDSWVRRTIMSESDAYYPAGIPHDEAADEDGIDVRIWGIDVTARPSLDEVLEVRAARIADVRRVVDALEPADIDRVCAPNPMPGNPEDTTIRVGACLSVVINEEWAHHGYALRDFAVLAPG